MLLMGKSTISMAIFQFAFCMFTRPGNFPTSDLWQRRKMKISEEVDFPQWNPVGRASTTFSMHNSVPNGPNGPGI